MLIFLSGTSCAAASSAVTLRVTALWLRSCLRLKSPWEVKRTLQSKAWFMAKWRWSLAMLNLLTSLPGPQGLLLVSYLQMTFHTCPLGSWAKKTAMDWEGQNRDRGLYGRMQRMQTKLAFLSLTSHTCMIIKIFDCLKWCSEKSIIDWEHIKRFL